VAGEFSLCQSDARGWFESIAESFGLNVATLMSRVGLSFHTTTIESLYVEFTMRIPEKEAMMQATGSFRLEIIPIVLSLFYIDNRVPSITQIGPIRCCFSQGPLLLLN
jgi:hypothetical protein